MSSNEELRNDEIQGQIIHIYDGIEEADNALPRWWLVTFFGAVVFSVFYWLVHESYSFVDYPEKAYQAARLEAMNKGGEVTEEDVVALVSDPAMVAAGKANFMKHCTKCHGNKAEGKEGPNLTDEFWLYGGSPLDIYNTIANGTSKGMAPWIGSLGSGQVKQLAAYVVTLRNTNVPGKAPQGPKWEPPAEDEAGAADSASKEEGAPSDGAAPETEK